MSKSTGGSGHPFTDNVVHETIDGETVIINLETGSYFSLEGAAAIVWEGLAAGEPIADTVARIAADAGADQPAVLAAALHLHGELFAAGLLREAPPSVPEVRDDRFTMPPMTRYDDMREHLLVDPIHEVERGEGWPAAVQP